MLQCSSLHRDIFSCLEIMLAALPLWIKSLGKLQVF